MGSNLILSMVAHPKVDQHRTRGSLGRKLGSINQSLDLDELHKSIHAIRRQRSIQGDVERASGCFERDFVLLGVHDRLWKPDRIFESPDLPLTSGVSFDDALLAVARGFIAS